MKAEKVNLITGQIPNDYYCACKYCENAIGELRREDGSYYSRLERREYYDASERGKGGHVAKTPLHIARWAVQRYTKPGDWVLDPTVGAGTTMVEAITQGRNAAGMELQFKDVLLANVEKNRTMGATAHIQIGDARDIGAFLDEIKEEFQLIVNNPPYSGDESDGGMGANHPLKHQYQYESGLPNLAFLKEGAEYWAAMEKIYAACIERLVPNGRFVVGVKDMMRKKKPFLLHKDFADLLSRLGLTHEGTAFLKHHPATLFLNTYEKRYGIKPPLYQTIVVFRK